MVHLAGQPLPSTDNKIWVTTNGGDVVAETHDELERAAIAFCRSGIYASMTLTEYLNKMFDASDYSKEVL